jgi:hypothetical protein
MMTESGKITMTTNTLRCCIVLLHQSNPMLSHANVELLYCHPLHNSKT